jgi:hypothetical protein
MSLYLGASQPAICMRCGAKVFASQLVNDGRNPQLLVCGADCWDPAHPQERPFVINDTEGLARFPVSPEQPFDTNPVATVEFFNPDDETFDITPAAAEGFVGWSDGSIWTMFGSGSGSVFGYTVAAVYTDATHEKFVLDLVDASLDPFAAIVVGDQRFTIENATITQIQDIRRFSWTCTATLFIPGVEATCEVQYDA